MICRFSLPRRERFFPTVLRQRIWRGLLLPGATKLGNLQQKGNCNEKAFLKSEKISKGKKHA